MKCIPLGLSLAICLMAATSQASPFLTLDFEEIVIPGDNVVFLDSFQDEGFSLTAVDALGTTKGFNANGSSSVFFAGSQALAALSPFGTTDAPTTISLVRDNGNPFSVLQIDLARNFSFDPAPTVTFTGTLADASTVEQTFEVTVDVGVAAFQTFTFSDDFREIVSLSWEQPVLAEGLHQFDNVRLLIPEPTGLTSLAIAGLVTGLVAARRRWGR